MEAGHLVARAGTGLPLQLVPAEEAATAEETAASTAASMASAAAAAMGGGASHDDVLSILARLAEEVQLPAPDPGAATARGGGGGQPKRGAVGAFRVLSGCKAATAAP